MLRFSCLGHALASAHEPVGSGTHGDTCQMGQGGDSAEGKAVLEIGDVYMSNTEVPGACDVLLGVGANKEMLTRNERTVSFCKNKVTGDHSPVHLSLIPAISRLGLWC